MRSDRPSLSLAPLPRRCGLRSEAELEDGEVGGLSQSVQRHAVVDASEARFQVAPHPTSHPSTRSCLLYEREGCSPPPLNGSMFVEM